MSYTQEVLMAGGFEIAWHPLVADDITANTEIDAGCWEDMAVVVQRIHGGSCRSDDWYAPLSHRFADIGEIKRNARNRLYRLYVRAFREEPGVLYLLHFAWKTRGSAGLIIQDGQIEVAFDRMLEIGTT